MHIYNIIYLFHWSYGIALYNPLFNCIRLFAFHSVNIVVYEVNTKSLSPIDLDQARFVEKNKVRELIASLSDFDTVSDTIDQFQQYMTENIDFAWGDGQWHPFINMPGLYVYNGVFSGFLMRMACEENIIVAHENERTAPVFVCS